MNPSDKRLEDVKSVVASARARIWPLAIGLLVILFSVLAPQIQAVEALLEKRETVSFVKEKVEASLRHDVRGMNQPRRKHNRLNHFRNRLNGEAAKFKADKLKAVPFEPFGVPFTVPFEFAPLIWITLATVMMFVIVSARQRGLNLLANALALSSKYSPMRRNADLLATPPIWFAPVWLSKDLDHVDKSELLRALGWSRWHNRIFTALTGSFLLATVCAQIWVAYIGHQAFLARCNFEAAFLLWPIWSVPETNSCRLTWQESLSVVGEVAVLLLGAVILAAWALPVAVRRLEEPPDHFLVFGRRRVLQVLGLTFVLGASAVYMGAPRTWATLRGIRHSDRREAYCENSLRYTQRRKARSIIANGSRGFYVNRNSGIIHAVESLSDCASNNMESVSERPVQRGRKVVAAGARQLSNERAQEGSCVTVEGSPEKSPILFSEVSFVRGLPKCQFPSGLSKLSIDQLMEALHEPRRQGQEKRRLRSRWSSTLVEYSALELWRSNDRKRAVKFLITVLAHDLAQRGYNTKPNIRLLDLAAGLACREHLDLDLGTIAKLAADNAHRHPALVERADKWKPETPRAAVSGVGDLTKGVKASNTEQAGSILVKESSRAQLKKKGLERSRIHWRAKWTGKDHVKWFIPGGGGDCHSFEL